MEELKNWDTFNLINYNDRKNAFQRMCTFLFCYTYKVTSLNEEPNHPGIETYPICYKGKKYGFQSKHFDDRISYPQIRDSVDALLKSEYCSSLDYFILYSNKNPTECESYIDIKNMLLEKGISLIAVCNEEILRLISTNKYYVIYTLFFKKSSLLDNYKFEVTKNPDLDSIINNNLIDLTLNHNTKNINLSKLPEEKSLKKVILIEGYAGSGKTVVMYYLYRFMTNMSKDRYEQTAKLAYGKKQYLYINFKTHSYNCKETINQIISEVETNFNNHKVVLFFDGFDEISDFHAREISNFINELLYKDRIEHIFISCRSLSIKRNYLAHKISDLDVFKIEPMSQEDKLEYAKTVLDKEQFILFENLSKTNSLLIQVEDPLCLKYITENITSIESDSSIFDLVKISIGNKMNFNEIDILEDKQNNIFIIIGKIAFDIYIKGNNRITLNELNMLFQKHFPKLNYSKINKSIDQLKNCGILIKCEEGLTFQHKRVFEYFLIENIYNKYLNDINILGKTNLFKYEDLFENIFLNRLKKEVIKSSTLNLPIEYNLFKTYMNENRSFGTDEPAFLGSDFFVDAFCSFDDQTIVDLLNSNSKLKKYFDSTKYTTDQMKNEYNKRIYRFAKRIKSSQALSEYLKDIMPKKISLGFEEAVEYNNQIYNDANKYVSSILKLDKGHYYYEYKYYSAFCKFIEFAMSKSNYEKRKNIVLNFDDYHLDWFCKVIFSPNLMSLLFNEELKESIKLQIRKLSLSTINTKIFNLFCGTIDKNDIDAIMQEIDKIHSTHDLDRKYNFVYAISKLDKDSLNYMEHISTYKLTLSLLKNEISCEEFVEEVFDDFEYIRCYHGEYGRQYNVSYFILQFIESKLTADNISAQCSKYFLKRKYLNIQLLSHLKRSKPNVAKKVINRGVLERLKDFEIMSLSSIEDRTDQLFQLSYLFNEYDYEISLKYFYDGYADSIIRIAWSKDVIIDSMLIKCFCAICNYLSDKDRRKYLYQILSMVEWKDTFTDGGGQIETFEILANNIYFNSKNEVCNFITWLKNHKYWNENVGFGILNKMFKSYWNIDEIWSIYKDEVQYGIERNHNFLLNELEVPFLLNIYDRCRMNDELKKDVKDIIKNGNYEDIEITLTRKQKILFDILCKNNHAKYQCNNNYEDFDFKPDIDNIDWENDEVYYWTNIINILYDNGKDAVVLTKHLKNNFYPNIEFHRTNWNALMLAGLENHRSNKIFYNLLLENSGYCGFYCIIDAYKNNPKISVPLYIRYHQFCQLLTR